ncbi:16S rRNA (uracil(1498)-N(3))-methyltransferase [Halalkalibacterium halodurans]|uniref:16S rRNA (uracil(1498)-N(3))-methyltransferase n=1 Tax=Halalkalibacterium halodurans TaxID=86665 RepID=UPI002AAA2BC7|nr:16S rRNA (uracil(1498)-N(3))-methyltransferase [Halalkalibacterium halodurans]MDY7221875.1 16S rRNA (uracil(1498)-N(3))-methyltransferase [Halalkalibacterium halodurans]MDY7241151.1 16S rRNA (uracil(1498)-N(3))-methyltransferase [Halalkalibacterium halodurans]
MQRYFVPKEQMTDTYVTITGDDVKHIIKVMRMTIGDEFICSDGHGRTVRCEIEKANDSEVLARVIEPLKPNTELPIRVTIAQALPKGDKLDYIVQKGTELGAQAFWLFSASRSIVKWDEKKGRKKTERLMKIAKEAAEQSYRERIPSIETPLAFSKLLQEISGFTKTIVAYEEEAKEGRLMTFAACLNELHHGDSLLVIIGPEGGFTTEEIDAIQRAGGAPAGLGPRILRTETASLYALAAISYHFERMR